MDKKIFISGLINTGEETRHGRLEVDAGTGLIKELAFEESNGREAAVCDYSYSDDYIIYSGDINGHSHPEQSIYTDIVDKSWELATWCRNTIYKYSPLLEPHHIYLACCRAFSRMLSYGVTSVFVSFYCHNNKGNEYDRAVIKAAADTGIRLYFGRMNYDIIAQDAYEAKKKSQQCYFEEADIAGGYFRELLEETDYATVAVAPSIHSMHASTGEAITSAIKLGEQYGRYVQFHLSEDKGDVDLSLKWYGLRPVEYLTSLVERGLVNSLENLLLSDCIWIDKNELRLIKEYGMKVVLNPRMNERIKAGKADFAGLIEHAIPLYVGTDGEASNDDLSVSGEIAFLKKNHSSMDEAVFSAVGAKPLKFNNGYIGKLEEGCYCDLKVIRAGKPTDVFVGGRRVWSAGKLLTMDVEEQIELPLKREMEKLYKE